MWRILVVAAGAQAVRLVEMRGRFAPHCLMRLRFAIVAHDIVMKNSLAISISKQYSVFWLARS